GRLVSPHAIVVHSHVVRAGQDDAQPGSLGSFHRGAGLVVLGHLVVAHAVVAGGYRSHAGVERQNTDAVAGGAVLLDSHARRIPHEQADATAGRRAIGHRGVRAWRV